MKICIVTDAWAPQINGVVKTLENTVRELKLAKHEILIIEPSLFTNIPCPSYSEIRLSLFSYKKISKLLQDFQPDALHVATEGPLGVSARRYAMKHDLNFTSAYHTKFPEYIEARTAIPANWLYPLVRWFHKPSKAVMVSTDTVMQQLAEHGFERLVKWSRGVDLDVFTERKKSHDTCTDITKPIFLYVGRIAVEKNIEAFLKIALPGEKWLVGSGPDLVVLSDKYPEAVFLGAKSHDDLAQIYQQANVFVFPSKTDTFGLVLLEALASGLPVAAYPVAGPIDVLKGCEAAAMRHDLLEACLSALELNPKHAREHAEKFTWKNTTMQFVANLIPFEKYNKPESDCTVKNGISHGIAGNVR
jgi:glycosyltransferase involved in cell wall biosynthesis